MANAQTVTIGNGTGNTFHVPFNTIYEYSFVEYVFPASEIGTAGTISAVSFYLGIQNYFDVTNDVQMFMKNVPRSEFAEGSDYEQVEPSNLVYSGSWTIFGQLIGWITIDLDTPFYYDGTSNLIIAMDENTPGHGLLAFTYTEIENAVHEHGSDTENPDPYNLDSFVGASVVSHYRPNVQLVFSNTDQPISQIEINGFTQPAWGAHPDFDLTVPDSAHYSIHEVEWHYNDGSFSHGLTPSDVFNIEGVPYFMNVYVEAASGYRFLEDATVLFNGDPSICDAQLNHLFNGLFETMTIDYYLTNDGVDDITAESAGVYPNPVKDVLYIDGAEDEMVSVFDVTGRLVMQQVYTGQLNVKDLKKGVYAVIIGGKKMKFVK